MNHSKMGKNRKGKPCHSFLPLHIGKAFEFELKQLISDLTLDCRSETYSVSELSCSQVIQNFKTEYLDAEILSKYLDPRKVSPDERRAAAIHKWLAVEERNATTNMRLMFRHEVDFGWATSEQIFGFAKKIVTDVLGPYRMETLFQRGSHTNGASTRVRRSSSAAIQKHGGEAHVSQSALPYWFTYAHESVLSEQVLAIQEASALFTVDKSSDIDRVACKEPEINMFLQRIVGSHIRKRLRKFGIDLNDQSVNQELARTAVSRKLATIDLSSASDSISLELVRALLPSDWFEVLDDLRVKATSVDGEQHSLNMFSSMGNGFTFELESLLFWALTRSVARFSGSKGTISVYGDDIICPNEISPRLARFFHFLGFRVNEKKSYWTGGFRESCGKHYYRGIDVTPFYLRAQVRSKTDLIRVLNQLLRWSSDEVDTLRGSPSFTHYRVAVFHQKWKNQLPTTLWGGQDLDSDSSLVTGDRPRSRLLRKVLANSFDHNCGLKFWLNTRAITEHPLSCEPSTSGRYYVTPQVPWLNSSAWNPYEYIWALPLPDS